MVAHCRSSGAEAERLTQTLAGYGARCHVLKADLSSEKETSDFLRAVNEYSVDSLVNNAGSYGVKKHFSELTANDIVAALMVNSVSPTLLAGQLFTHMREKGFGRIVNISSIAAKYGGSSESLHYGCSKRALEGLTLTLAREGAPFNILVNTVRPGVIDTEFHRKFPKDMAKRVTMIPLKRMGQPDDVADMVFYLGTDRNNFITGEIITVAGGE